MFVDRLQQGPISRSVRAHRVRKLRSRHRSRGQTSRARLVGHGGPRRLRPSATAVLSGLGRDRHVFWHRQSGQFGEHHRKVAARSETLLSASARGARGQQEGLAK